MKINVVKSFAWALVTGFFTLLILWIAATVLVIGSQNGGQAVHQTVNFLGLPLFTVDSSKEGFSISSQIGFLIVPLAAALIAFVTAMLSRAASSHTV
jgi:hypothetical protein